MLPKNQRIVNEKEIKDIIKRKEIKQNTPTLNIAAKISDRNRFLVIGSKKVGNSVKRNRLRRILYPIFARSCVNMSKKLDIIVNIRNGNDESRIKDELKGFMAKW